MSALRQQHGVTKGNRRIGRIAVFTVHGVVTASVALMMWLHAVLPMHLDHDGRSFPVGHGDSPSNGLVVLAASAGTPMEPPTVLVSASATSADNSGGGVLTLVVVLLVLGVAIKAIGLALRVVLEAAANLAGMLFSTCALFVIAFLMLAAQLGIGDAGQDERRTVGWSVQQVDAVTAPPVGIGS